MQRRKFLISSLHAGAVACAMSAGSTQAQTSRQQLITLIDLDRCDGCVGHSIPACVQACRQEHAQDYPEPKKPLMPYWPQTKYEDFSDQRDGIDRLTPYNWIFIETVEVDGKTLYLPRRCMHCFDAPCRKLCPFGAIDQTRQGAIKINDAVCFGGAKCRDVCPWHIPQRQAGVGLYLKAAPRLAGGGVMYKCDMCARRLERNEPMACVDACPQKAMITLPLNAMKQRIQEFAQGRYLYGDIQNGGTATWYVSRIDFTRIDAALKKAHDHKMPQGVPAMPDTQSALDASRTLAAATLAAPVVGVLGAIVLRQRKADQKESS